jgi:hypothetical protein
MMEERKIDTSLRELSGPVCEPIVGSVIPVFVENRASGAEKFSWMKIWMTLNCFCRSSRSGIFALKKQQKQNISCFGLFVCIASAGLMALSIF